MTKLEETVKYLSKNRYLVKHNDYYILTAKFNEAISGKDYGIVSCKSPQVKEPKDAEPNTDWTLVYATFILETVPVHSRGKEGPYQVNLYSKPGEQAFRKVIENGELTIAELAKRVRIYYMSDSGKYKVKIETFFVKELWRNVVITPEKSTRSEDGYTFSQPNL